MEIPVYENELLANRAREIMNEQDLKYNPFKALIIAEIEIEKQKKIDMGERYE